MSTRNINVSRYEDEYALFGKALPYIAMLIGAGLAFVVAVITRLGIWAQLHWHDTSPVDSSRMITYFIVVSCVVLSALAWKLFKPRQIVHYYVAWHAVITTILIHAWLLMAVWQGLGDWMFGAPTVYMYFFGGIVIGVSWCIRRWAYREDMHTQEEQGNVFAAIGLGEATHLDRNKSYKTENGAVYRMRLQYGKTIEDAKGKIAEIAHIAGKSRKLVHVSETETGIEGQVDITVLNDDPFKVKRMWTAPLDQEYGLPITLPIAFATYDTGERGVIYIAGKDGGSSQHYLTVGMSGTGKSKGWQAIYGTLLSRREVSVIFGDPAKGMQTGGCLASKLAWFATTEEDCLEQIEAVMRSISIRTDYLTTKGLSQWEPGCGMNLLVFHLEEAARFAKVNELVQLLEAARSAGIVIVLSLQKATGDRINTSARYNLGANMCFGVKSKRDAEFGLSEYARKSGARPDMWQDRYPGHFYLEATGLDPRMAAHELLTDWVDTAQLQRAVDSYPENAMDNVTADALGMPYQEYRDKVAAGTTNWQQMRANIGFRDTTPVMGATFVEDTVPWDIDVELDDTKVIATVKPNNLNTDPQDTADAIAEFNSILTDWQQHGKITFSNKELVGIFTRRGAGWVSKRLAAMAKNGQVEKTTEGLWRIISI